MEQVASTSPKWLAPTLWVIILAALGLSAGMLWWGLREIATDRRIQTGGLEARATIVSLNEPRRSRNAQPSRSGWIRYRLAAEGEIYGLEISRETWSTLRVGQSILIMVDPADPNRHQFDRDKQIWTAWVFTFGGLGLGALSLGLLVWALRGGFRPGLRGDGV